MKKQLLLLALTLGTQVSAETLKNALGNSAEAYLTIIDTHLNVFQKQKLKTLNKLLSLDVTEVTPEQLERIIGEIDAFADIVSPKLEDDPDDDMSDDDMSDDDGGLSQKKFSKLAKALKDQLPLVIQKEKRAQEEALLRLAQEAEQRVAEEAALQKLAEETRLAEAPLLASTIAAPTFSISMLGAEGSTTTDPIANPLLTGRLAQFTENLSTLDDESSSDPVDRALVAYGDNIEDFLKERMDANVESTTADDYEYALENFFKTKGLEIDYKTLSAVAKRLRDMQTIYYEPEDDEEEDMDALINGLNAQEVAQLPQELGIQDPVLAQHSRNEVGAATHARQESVTQKPVEVVKLRVAFKENNTELMLSTFKKMILLLKRQNLNADERGSINHIIEILNMRLNELITEGSGKWYNRKWSKDQETKGNEAIVIAALQLENLLLNAGASINLDTDATDCRSRLSDLVNAQFPIKE